jgi:hypothetical protein
MKSQRGSTSHLPVDEVEEKEHIAIDVIGSTLVTK